MAIRTIKDIEMTGKAVLMRVDFNVPLRQGKITSDRRIVQALPSIEAAIRQRACLVLMSHMGRPAERGFEPAFSLQVVADRLSELLGKPVRLGPPVVVGPAVEKQVGTMRGGDVVLLENLRFQPGETMPDMAEKNPDNRLTPEQKRIHDDFVHQLAKLGTVYVNDAFGTCHREHASMYGVAKAIQAKGGPAVAGFLVEKEIKYLSDFLAKPARPYIAILGGSKVSDKVKLIASLVGKADRILIGGAMAYTLLQARGTGIGKSLVEGKEAAREAKRLLSLAGDKILLPCDHIVTDSFDAKHMAAGKPITITEEHIPDGMLGMDIGPKTIEAFGDHIASAGTVVWNGPLGVAELDDYANGTSAIVRRIVAATGKGTVSIIGGGDSAAVVEKMGVEDRMSHVSTGGGASLKYIEGSPMPPIEVLDRR